MKYTNLKDLFTAIANAIRGKEGSTAAIVADDFPERIAAIETQDTTIEDALVSGNIKFSKYENNRVKEVSYGAFMRNEILQNETLFSVRFDNVETVYEYAFFYCAKLSSVVMPNVKTIYGRAFTYTAVKKLVLPKLARIFDFAFSNTFSLEHMDMFGTIISDYAFSYSNIETLILRNNQEMCSLYDVSAFENTPIESGTGYIYVPASMVDAYKADEAWGVYKSQIRAIEDYPEITGG